MNHYDVAAYIWPAYTGDEYRSRMFWPEGDGEWQSVRNVQKNSMKKPSDYHWNRKPLWGYVNEADPHVMEMEIDCAYRHGVNVFIYDWYWYDNRPFLENCLNDGYLKASNHDLVRFYLMWSNHNANHVWNIELSDTIPNEVIWNGEVNFATFQKLVARWISKYFSQPSYYKIDGKPVFMIYSLKHLILGLGGLEHTRMALDYFRNETIKAGFPGLHLQATVLTHQIFDPHAPFGNSLLGDPYHVLGFDSATHYQMKDLYDMNWDYEQVIRVTAEQYAKMDALSDVTYFPQVTLGWDNNPRFRTFQPCFTTGNTPDKIELALRQAKTYVDCHSLPAPLVVINSWNEWTETSYLQPDTLYGYGYLEAVKNVFLSEESK